jgi:Ca2+-binding EF-hand superfamily protein
LIQVVSKHSSTLGDFSKSQASKETNTSEILLNALRAELAKRGTHGMVGLQRKFRIIDDNGDGQLNIGEFKKAMNECGLNLSSEVCSSNL